jgi:hypothetical protein
MWVGEATLDGKRGGVHCLQKLAMSNPLKFNAPLCMGLVPRRLDFWCKSS